MTTHSVTRGHGLLESFLARKRAGMANALIPSSLRAGNILDIGCGSFPYFLLTTEFHGKHGLDQMTTPEQSADFQKHNIHLHVHTAQIGSALPFEDGMFDVVTMLAVFEHVERDLLLHIVKEIRRVLRPSGRYVLTTPARWTDGILKTMAKLRLVSPVEIDEHEELFDRPGIAALLQEAGFHPEKVKTGTFEWGMNLWAVAEKE